MELNKGQACLLVSMKLLSPVACILANLFSTSTLQIGSALPYDVGGELETWRRVSHH